MKIGKETWVEIHDIVLKPEERTGNLPEETKKVPLEMRLKGFLLEEAELGDRVKIRTVTGRIVEGTLLKENPVYEHGYGETFVPELLTIGQNLRAMLEVDHE
jgi:hypothetical protein